MSNIFLDANFIIDLLEHRREISEDPFEGNILFLSPLSIHIVTYTFRYKIPHATLNRFMKMINIIPLDNNIVEKSLEGPSKDFEDNIQLHSAVEAQCDLFLTSDKDLLEMKFFGKMKISSSL